MSRYRIIESVAHHVEVVHSYEDLEIHHFSKNKTGLKTGRPQDFEHGRPHQRVNGQFEEVRPQPDGRLLVKKDFVLSHDGDGPVNIPSPVDGYVHYLHDKTAAIRIYDRPFGEPGANLLAQSLHMNPHTFHVKEGEHIAYGQPMGVMSDSGTPGVVHAHVEAEPDQFRKYIRDIDSGVITPDSYPALAGPQPEQQVGLPAPNPGQANPHVIPSAHAGQVTQHATPAVRHTLRGGDTVAWVEQLQRALSHLGYRDPHGHALIVDGTPGPNTEHAIRSFQHVHQLHVDGVAGKDTLAALADARHSPLLSEATHPAHSLYTQVMQGVQKLPHGTYNSEDEQRNLAVALTIAAHVGGLKNVDHVALGTNGVNIFAVQGRVDDPAHLRTHVDRAEVVTHVVDHRNLAFQQDAHAHPVHAHVHASPDVGQRAPGMEINR